METKIKKNSLFATNECFDETILKHIEKSNVESNVKSNIELEIPKDYLEKELLNNNINKYPELLKNEQNYYNTSNFPDYDVYSSAYLSELPSEAPKSFYSDKYSNSLKDYDNNLKFNLTDKDRFNKNAFDVEKLRKKLYDNIIVDYTSKVFLENPLTTNDNFKFVNNEKKLLTEYKFLAKFNMKTRKTNYIRCPKTFVGTFEEAYVEVLKKTNFFSNSEKLPFGKNEIKKQLVFKPKTNIPKNNTYITRKEFLIKNNKNFNTRLGTVINNTITNISNLFNTVYSNKCQQGVVLLTNDGVNTYIGITTGNYCENTGSFEIICYKNNSNNVNFIKEDNFKKIFISNGHIKHVFDIFSNTAQNFFRLKIINIENSIALFGFKQAKEKMLNNFYVPTDYNIIKNYFCKKLAKEVDVVEILSEDGRFLKFLLNDIDFYGINLKFNCNKINQLIQIGSKVRIKDNRKTKFQKNQQVIITKININKSNFKNSLVVVTDDNNVKSLLLLKQLKLIL